MLACRSRIRPGRVAPTSRSRSQRHRTSTVAVTLARSVSTGSTCPSGRSWLTAINARSTAAMVLSVCPLAGAGTGSLVSSDTEIWSASASARISFRVGERSPRSIRFRVSLLIPASPATTRSDLPRSSRTRHSAQPIARASSPSIEHPLVHRGHVPPTDAPGSYPGADTSVRVRGQATCQRTQSSDCPPTSCRSPAATGRTRCRPGKRPTVANVSNS